MFSMHPLGLIFWRERMRREIVSGEQAHLDYYFRQDRSPLIVFIYPTQQYFRKIVHVQKNDDLVFPFFWVSWYSTGTN
jgi:hypothetical protein